MSTTDLATARWKPSRWGAHGCVELEFDATREELWDAWVKFTQVPGKRERYECEIRHWGDAQGLGLIRAWLFPMPGGVIARSWEWIYAINPGWSVSYEGVAAPPLAFAAGTLTLTPIDESRTRLQHDEYYEFVNRLLKPLSRFVHRRITEMNKTHTRQWMNEYVEAGRRAAGQPAAD